MGEKVTQGTEGMSSMGRGRKVRRSDEESDLPGVSSFLYTWFLCHLLHPSQSHACRGNMCCFSPEVSIWPWFLQKGPHSSFVRTVLFPLAFSATPGSVSSSEPSLSQSIHPLYFRTPPSLVGKLYVFQNTETSLSPLAAPAVPFAWTTLTGG